MNKHPSNVSETASNKPASNATAFTLPGTAVAPYRAFTAALSNGDTCPVHASNGTDWQDFIGTYSAGTLAQTTLLESSTGSWIDWSAGADVLLEIAWLGATGEDADAHLSSASNPHSVTAAQVGSYTSGAVDTLLTGKSDTGHTHTGVYEPASAGIQSHISDTTLHSVGTQIHAATGKATPVDADELGLVDSADSNVLKKLTWANLKVTLTSIFALLAGKAGGQTLIGGSAVTDALVLQGTSGNGTAASPAVQMKAGNNGATTALTALNNGNVGIGATSPVDKLHVAGGSLRISDSTTETNALKFTTSSSAATIETRYLFPLIFGANATEAMRILPNGNVGIGTTSPSAKLQVNGSNDVDALRVYGGDPTWNTQYVAVNEFGTLQGVGKTDAAMNSMFGAMGSSDTYNRIALGLNTGSPFMGFGPGNATRDVFITRSAANTLRVSSDGSTGAGNLIINGNVGIGTTNPSAKLTVNTGNIHYNTTYTDASNYERLAITGTAGSNVEIKAETAGTGADNLSILLTPAGTGNVGIGTTAPSALLDINSDTLRVRTSRTPASATATGNAGDVCWDTNYIYVCTATNTWKRSAISTW